MLEHLRSEVLSRQQYAQLQAAFDSLNQNIQTDDETEPQEGEDVCVICWDQRADRAIVPCGHLCLCSRCSAPATIQGNLRGRCPVCQCTALGPMRVFRSGVPTPGDGSSIAAPTLLAADDETSGASASLLRAQLSLLRAQLIAIAKSIALCPIYHWLLIFLLLLFGLGIVVITEAHLAFTTDIEVLRRWLISTLIAIIVIAETAVAFGKRLDRRCKASNTTKNVIKVIAFGFFFGILAADSLPDSSWQCLPSISFFLSCLPYIYRACQVSLVLSAQRSNRRRRGEQINGASFLKS